MFAEPLIDSGWTVLLDRDGVINRRIVGDYVRKLEQFALLPGAVAGIALLAGSGARVLVVTNQAGVAKGLIDPDELRSIHRHLIEAAAAGGGRIDHIFCCPHQPSDGCACRKPGTGMFDQAVALYPDIDRRRTIMIGDSDSDMAFGERAGVRTMRVQDEHAAPVDGAQPDLLAAARLLTGAG